MAITKVTSGLISADASSIDLNIDAGTLYLDVSENRVGIGTTSPAKSLDVQSGTANSNIAHFTGSNSTRGMTIATYNADSFDDAGVDLYGLRELRFSTNVAEAMRIDSSGKLLVGATSNTSRGGSATKALIKLDTGESYFDIQASSTSANSDILFSDASGGDYGILGYQHSTDSMLFYTTSTERMRINSSGQLLIGRTSARHDTSGIEVEGSSSGGKGAVLFQGTGDNGPAINAYKTSTTTSSSARFIQFAANSGSTSMGAIVGNGASNVQFITLSDEREKENINPVVGALDKLMNLNVVSFDWKKHDEHVKAGFIAQNVEESFPEYVVENIANDGEEARKGTTGGMSAGYIAVLTKAIQELSDKVDNQQTIIDNLTTRIETLENA